MVKRAQRRPDVGIIERGSVYFAYPPAVDAQEPKGLADIQRFYMVLSPRGKDIYRVIMIGRKRLPDVSSKERNWGVVMGVAESPEGLEDELGREEYETKTRGTRQRPPARPCGEGVYCVARHQDHTHLAYVLELPEKLGDVQRELNIDEEASYIITVKNPEASTPPGAGLSAEERVEYPSRLQAVFEGRRFIDADPADLLDYPGTEIVLIGAGHDVGRELGLDLEPESETAHSAGIFRDLRLDREEHPVEPLFKGMWK